LHFKEKDGLKEGGRNWFSTALKQLLLHWSQT